MRATTVFVAALPLTVGLLAACSKSSSTDAPSAITSTATTAAMPSASTAAASVSAAPAQSGSDGSAPGSTAMSGFEGKIVVSVAGASIPQGMDLALELKGNKVRFGMPSLFPGMPWGLVDPTSKKMSMVMDGQKMVIVTDLNAAAKTAPGAAKPAATFVKTTTTDTVAGQTCTIWNTVSGGRRTELCVVTGLASFNLGALGGGAGPDLAWANGLDGEGAMPIRVVTYDSSNKETMRMAATSITRQPIDDARFQIPAGYTTMNGSELGGVGMRLPPGVKLPAGVKTP